MRKCILLLTIVFISTVVFSQVTYDRGVRAGINLANISDTNAKSKADFYAGGFFEMKFSKLYGLQLELVYSRQGSKWQIAGDEDLKLHYVGFSISNKFSPLGDSMLHFIIGPTLDVRVNSNLNKNIFDINPLDLSFYGGIGYDFPFGLTIEARYKQGIVDVDNGFTEIGNNSINNNNNFNTVIQLGIAYKLSSK